MTTTINAIADILKREDIGYMFNQKKNFLFIAIKLDDIKEQGIVIKVIENGKIVQVNAPLLFQVNGSLHKGIVMQKIFELQFKTSILKFTCNTLEDQKQYIEARIDFPVYHSNFAEDDLFFCFNFLRAKLIEQLPRLQHILATGYEPPQQSQLEQMSDDMSAD